MKHGDRWLAKAKNYIYTDLSEDDVLEVEIDGQTYKAVNFTMSFALNSIPQAAATLAIGREALSGEPAKIAETAAELTSMKPVKVTFNAGGEWDSEGTKWPGKQTIFEGYFTGFSYKKLYGKVQVVANFIHWLVDLGFSSCLNSQMHVGNPGVMLGPAVMSVQINSAGGAGASDKNSALVANHIGYDLIANNVESDWWKTIKSYLCALAGVSGLATSATATCEGTGDITANDRALRALSRIEGEDLAGECSRDYEFGKALPLESRGQRQVPDAVAKSVANSYMQSYFNQTFWDLLVKDLLPSFGAAVMPLVDRAVVIADLPTWQGVSNQPWKEIGPDEYVAMEQDSKIPQPLRGIGIYAPVAGETNVQSVSGPYKPQLGGCYVSDAEEDSDGTLKYVTAPRWLLGVPSEGLYAGAMTGNKEEKSIKSATHGQEDKIDTPEDPSPVDTFETVNELMVRYAHWLFTMESLRGRSAIFSGRLRFDIAPGSHLKIVGSPEQFLETDALASDVYGMVRAVTIGIDIEARAAVTSYVLSHNRNEAENEAERTSIEEHPLFGSAIVNGAPLVKALDLGSEDA